MLVASTQRPIPLRSRPDLRITPIVYQGTTWYVIKDPIALQYYRLRDDQFRVLRLLDGCRSLEDLRGALRSELPSSHYTHSMLQQLVTDLHQKQLVSSNRIGQGPMLRHEARREWWGRIKQFAMNPLAITFPGWDAQRLLDRLLPWIGWIFEPLPIVGVAIYIGAALGWLGLNYSVVQSRTPELSQFFAGPNLVWMWLTLCGAKIIHEFGHGLACRHYGAECHQMGVMLLVAVPCLYCETTDSWILPRKWQRIMIAAAGMYFELILSAIAIFVWWNTADGLLNHMCLNLVFVTSVSTIVFNLNPLMRLDGYYMLSDFLEIPNLRPSADKMLRERFSSICLGIEPQPDPFAPERGQTAFLLFSIAAWLYRWVVVFSIMYFLCSALKPYGLQSVGMTAAAISLGGMLATVGITFYRIVTSPQEEPLKRGRIVLSLLALAGLVALLILVPLPLFYEAPFLVEPRDVQHVYVSVPGMLLESRVKPGDRVHRGDVLAVLQSVELEYRRRELKLQLQVEGWDRRTAHVLGNSTQNELSEWHLKNLGDELRDIDDQIAQLIVKAPIDGRVVAPERVPEPRHDVDRNTLSRWYGTPLEPANIGCQLEASTPLLSIAPSEEFDAIVYIDQSDREYLSIDSPVSLKIDEFPNVTIRGRIQQIAVEEERYAPPGLTVKQGSKLSTVSARNGLEQLNDPVYRAIVAIPLDQLPALGQHSALRSEMRGRARISAPRSLTSWAWRSFRQVVHFRL